jgi:hypothetical protein
MGAYFGDGVCPVYPLPHHITFEAQRLLLTRLDAEVGILRVGIQQVLAHDTKGGQRAGDVRQHLHLYAGFHLREELGLEGLARPAVQNGETGVRVVTGVVAGEGRQHLVHPVGPADLVHHRVQPLAVELYVDIAKAAGERERSVGHHVLEEHFAVLLLRGAFEDVGQIVTEERIVDGLKYVDGPRRARYVEVEEQVVLEELAARGDSMIDRPSVEVELEGAAGKPLVLVHDELALSSALDRGGGEIDGTEGPRRLGLIEGDVGAPDGKFEGCSVADIDFAYERGHVAEGVGEVEGRLADVGPAIDVDARRVHDGADGGQTNAGHRIVVAA